MNIVYSFNKKGYEARYWEAEIRGASTAEFKFIPFNHDSYVHWTAYARAQLLDNIYYQRHAGLMALYRDFEEVVRQSHADAVIVDNCPPYHPDYLRRLDVYKVLRVADGPKSAYDRDFAYLHAYDHILYHSPAYSRDMGMAEKLEYCGAKRFDFWPLALFDAAFDPGKTGPDLVAQERDIDVVFVGGQHIDKLPLLATVKRAFGRRFRLHGVTTLKTNVYFNLRYGGPGWVRPLAFERQVPLYKRSKIGINVHNRGKYTVGNYRLFDLAGNGVMQISDGDEYLNDFFSVGDEISAYSNPDDLVDKIRYYLANDNERYAMALRAHERVMRDHRFAHRMHQLGELIQHGAARLPSMQKGSARGAL
jgi:hypothetical protein